MYSGNDPERYADILDLPHHRSDTHPAMPALKRAAQFAPFAALHGYQEAIEEARSRAEERVERGEPHDM